MAAENGNKYAERWTYDKTLAALNEVHTWALSPDCLYLGHALNQAGLYNDLWAYWRRKWRGNARIITLMKRILQLFEVRLFQNTALGKIPARVGLFALTHHYEWGREYETMEEQQQQRTEQDRRMEEERREDMEAPADELAATEARRAQQAKLLKEFNERKVAQYNVKHPAAQLTMPMSWHLGTPPEGAEAVLFDSGYFLRL